MTVKELERIMRDVLRAYPENIEHDYTAPRIVLRGRSERSPNGRGVAHWLTWCADPIFLVPGGKFPASRVRLMFVEACRLAVILPMSSVVVQQFGDVVETLWRVEVPRKAKAYEKSYRVTTDAPPDTLDSLVAFHCRQAAVEMVEALMGVTQ
jgi:hypothetical protein